MTVTLSFGLYEIHLIICSFIEIVINPVGDCSLLLLVL